MRTPHLDAARTWYHQAVPLPPGAIAPVLAAQREDGSWGAADDAHRRVLTTLLTASVLADLDVADSSRAGAVEFLERSATTTDGVFSRDSRPAGVLSCYVAIAASTYLATGRPDLAAPQVDWILRYQDVRAHDRAPRGRLPVYHPGLAVRYGGCLSATTCLIGVVKAGRALELWRRTAPADATRSRRDDVDEMLTVVRESLLERGLMHRTDGRVLPLGTPPARADEWLTPTFPLDWRTDLTEVLELVARTGPADPRMQPAIDRLAAAELPGGGWPLLRAFWPTGFPALEARSARRPSRLATRRALAAFDALDPHETAA